MARNNDINIKLNLIIKQFIEAMKKAGLETKDLEKELKDIETQSKKTGKAGKFSFTEINQGVELARRGLALLKKALDMSIQFKNASRDAEETRNKFDEVFSSIKKVANATAQEMAKSFGLAESTAKKLLASTGDILVGFGFAEEEALDLSKQVVELSQDLASFTNMEGGAERATDALTKAVVGETESVKAMGIVIRQGTADYKARYKEIMNTTGASETQAKAITNLRIAQEQSTKAQGDYARTSESLANVERRRVERTKELYETIGDQLAPAFLKLNEIALDFIDIAIGEEVSKVTTNFLDQTGKFNTLVSEWSRLRDIEEKTTEELESYNQTVSDLQEQYPLYLGNLDFEKDGYDKITQAIKLTNLELEAKYINMVKDEDQANIRRLIAEKEIEIQKIKTNQTVKSGELEAKYRARNIQLAKDQIEFEKMSAKHQKTYKSPASQMYTEEQIKAMSQYKQLYQTVTGETKSRIEDNINALEDELKALNKKLALSEQVYTDLEKSKADEIKSNRDNLVELEKMQNFYLAFSTGDYGGAIRALNADADDLIDTLIHIPPVKIPIEIEGLDDDPDLAQPEDVEQKITTTKYNKEQAPTPPAYLATYEAEKQAKLEALKDDEEMFKSRLSMQAEFLEYGVITKEEYLLKEKELRERYKQEEEVEKEEEEISFIEALERRLAGVEQFYSSVNQIASNLAQVELNKLKKQYKDEKSLLDKKLKNGIISKIEYDKQIAILNNKNLEAERKIKEKQRDWSYGLAVIDGAKAITGIWATWSANPIFASILTALAVASTLTQLEVISSQTFGDGGVSDGPSHSQGGIDLFSNVSGRHLGNIEGGEGIVNKRAMSNPLARTAVSAINELFGGRRFPNTMRRGGMTPRSYQRGGVAPLADNETIESNAIVQELRELRYAVDNIPAPIIQITNESDISELTTEVMNEIGEKSRNNLDTDEIMQIGQRG